MANLNNREVLTKTIFAGILAAFTAAMAQIHFPLPSGVPVTLQTFAVALTAFLLGPAFGTASIGVYILVGAMGVPVFSGFGSGIGALIGLTGGFIYGFLPFAFLCGLSNHVRNGFLKAVLCLAGLASCHLLGVLQFALLYKISFWLAFLRVSVPYLVKDAASIAVAYALAAVVLKRTEKLRAR